MIGQMSFMAPKQLAVCLPEIRSKSSHVVKKKRRELFYDTFGSICDEIYIENLVDLWPQVESNMGIEILDVQCL